MATKTFKENKFIPRVMTSGVRDHHREYQHDFHQVVTPLGVTPVTICGVGYSIRKLYLQCTVQTCGVLYMQCSVHAVFCTCSVLYMRCSVHAMFCTRNVLYMQCSVHAVFCTCGV